MGMENDGDSVVVDKNTIEKENKTLFWVLIFVVVVFALVLIPYFWSNSSKSFEFGGVDWLIEDYEGLRIFHGRFIGLTNPNIYYNVFFRTDPRKNNAEVVGRLDSFKYGGIISLSPDVDACRGELSRVMLDLSSFLKQGVGVGPIKSGSNNEKMASESGRKFVNCDNVLNRTVIVIEIGEQRIVQDEENLNCYTIYAENCEDSGIVEKFILRTVEDFRESYPAK